MKLEEEGKDRAGKFTSGSSHLGEVSWTQREGGDCSKEPMSHLKQAAPSQRWPIMPRWPRGLYFFLMFIIERQTRSMRGGGAEREGDTESEASSRL